jgi:PAS domain S-box-containing protein
MPDLKFVRAAVESSRSAMVVTDPRQPDNPLVSFNDAFCQLTGYAKDELLGRNCRFLQGPDTHPEAVSALRYAVGAGTSGIATLMNYRKDGSAFLSCVQILPVRDEDGRIIFFVGSQFEVTPLETVFPMSADWTFEG